MATKHGNIEECSSQTKKNLNDWKYPKIPIDQVYKKQLLKISPSYAVKDFEDTITVNSNVNVGSVNLLSKNFLKGFVKKQHKFVHLGLVQVAVKPLMRDGLGAPIVVSLRDARHLDFHNSLLALVNANLSQGPFYFDCFPSFSVSLDDASLYDVLTLDIELGRVPLALTYRVVCKAMVDLSPEALKEPVLGETAFFQPAIGTRSTTKWNEFELQVDESSSTSEQVLKKGSSSISSKSVNEEGNYRLRISHDDWKYPKIPVDKLYDPNRTMYFSELFQGISLWSKAKRVFKMHSTVKDYEKTITLKDTNKINVSINLLEGIVKKKGYVHLGLFQIAIKPLLNDELGAPIIVCLRDTRLLKFNDSLLALVEANVSDGPFYFNCSPGHSISSSDTGFYTLSIKSGVPLVFAYRIVCNVTTDITLDYWQSIVRGETTYYHPITGTERTTNWDEVQVPKSWISS